MKLNRKKVEILLAENVLSMSGLAKKCGVTCTVICRQLKAPSLRPVTVGKIAAALGVPVTDIIVKEE